MGTLFSSDEEKVKALVNDTRENTYGDILKTVNEWIKNNKDTPYYKEEEKKISELTAEDFYKEYKSLKNINATRLLWAKAVCMGHIERLLQETWINEKYTFSQWTDIFNGGGNNPLIPGEFHFPVLEKTKGIQQVNILCMAIIQGYGNEYAIIDFGLIGRVLDVIEGNKTLKENIFLKPMGKMISGPNSIFIKQTTPSHMFYETLKITKDNYLTYDILIKRLKALNIDPIYSYNACIIPIEHKKLLINMDKINNWLEFVKDKKIGTFSVVNKKELYSACERCGKRSRLTRKKKLG